MIRDALIPTLMARFPGLAIRTGDPPSPVVVIPAAHPEVGDLSIWDDGDEAIVGIGTITHGHFGAYDGSASPEESAVTVVDDVADFLEAVFSGRVLLWKSVRGRGGGWRYLGSLHRPMPFGLGPQDFTYLWSGPVQNPYRDGVQPDFGES